MHIQASWICDDEKDAKAAKKCRDKAIEMILIGQALSQYLSDQAGASEAITIDLMRRAGCFQEAIALARETSATAIDDVIKKIIRYEVGLIDDEDVDAHTIDDALNAQAPNW